MFGLFKKKPCECVFMQVSVKIHDEYSIVPTGEGFVVKNKQNECLTNPQITRENRGHWWCNTAYKIGYCVFPSYEAARKELEFVLAFE